MQNQLIKDTYRSDLSAYIRFRNDFTAVLAGRYPVFEDILEDFKESGSVYSNLTGSGSVVFGLFESEKEAEKGLLSMKKRHKFVQKIKSLDRIPYAILE
jgi:4-diphosphocytidyl-2-C-methyl-D-erythritol kinase